MTLFIDQPSCPHLNDSLACFSWILCVEHLLQFLQSPIFRLNEEEVYDAIDSQLKT